MENFYQAPEEDHDPSAVNDTEQHSQIDINGKFIIGTSPMILPSICVKCGADHNPDQEDESDPYHAGGKHITNTFSWANPLVFLLLLVSWLVLLIVYFIIRKKIKVSFFYCGSCVARRKKLLLITSGLLLGGIALLIGGIAIKNGPVAIAGTVAALASLIVAIINAYPIRATKCDKGTFTLKGPCALFLQKASEQIGLEEA